MFAKVLVAAGSPRDIGGPSLRVVTCGDVCILARCSPRDIGGPSLRGVTRRFMPRADSGFPPRYRGAFVEGCRRPQCPPTAPAWFPPRYRGAFVEGVNPEA